MATNYTKTQLVGSLSTVSIPADQAIIESQEMSPPGLSVTFKTPLGAKGRYVTITGLMRFSGASRADATANLNAKYSELVGLKETGVVINAFGGVADVHTGQYGIITECVVETIGLTGEPRFVAGNIMIRPYTLVLRKLRD